LSAFAKPPHPRHAAQQARGGFRKKALTFHPAYVKVGTHSGQKRFGIAIGAFARRFFLSYNQSTTYPPSWRQLLMKSPARGFAASTVLMAAALGLGLNGPHRAQAAAPLPTTQNDGSVAVSILSPTPRQAFDGVKPVEISAFYQGSTGNQVVSIELFVDGNKAAQKVLDAPETRGVVSFLVDASALSSGPHRIVVRVTGSDAEIASARSSFSYQAPAPPAAAAPEETSPRAVAPLQTAPAPTLSIAAPRGMEDGQVQGTVKLRVQASDPSGKAPFVSIFIDRQFKTLRNYAPYEFDWDTTTAPNGYHTIEAFGYNDAQAVGHAQSLRLYVNNPGGRTERRTDLLDAAPAPNARKASKSVSATGRKAHKVARRPQAPLLAVAKAATPSVGRASHRLRMAQVFALIQRSARLSEMPALSPPFVGEAAVPAPLGAAHTIKVVHTHTSVPTRGFKPFARGVAMGTGGALLALTPSTHPVRMASPKLMRLSPVGLTGAELSSEFMLSPTLPQIKATVSAHTTLSASPSKTLRVMTSVPQPRQAVRAHTLRAARALRVHMPKMASQINWLRAVGQSTVLFNSSRLPLDRPLSAQGSVMFGPLRQIFQQGGGSLMWQARTGIVHARSQNRDVLVTIGKKSALVNNAVVMLDGRPYLNDGRTMIPLSFLKQAMNVDVNYDPTSGHLVITSKP